MGGRSGSSAHFFGGERERGGRKKPVNVWSELYAASLSVLLTSSDTATALALALAQRTGPLNAAPVLLAASDSSDSDAPPRFGQPHCPIIRGISTHSHPRLARTSLESTQIVQQRYRPHRPVIREN